MQGATFFGTRCTPRVNLPVVIEIGWIQKIWFAGRIRTNRLIAKSPANSLHSICWHIKSLYKQAWIGNMLKWWAKNLVIVPQRLFLDTDFWMHKIRIKKDCRALNSIEICKIKKNMFIYYTDTFFFVKLLFFFSNKRGLHLFHLCNEQWSCLYANCIVQHTLLILLFLITFVLVEWRFLPLFLHRTKNSEWWLELQYWKEKTLWNF